MKIYSLIILLLCFNSIFPIAAIAQDTDAADPFRAGPEVIFPPLSVMIDSALATNPMIRFRDQGITGKQCNLKTYQTNWSKNLGIQADVRYGTFDNFSTNTSEGQNPSAFATKSNQSNWGVGAYIKFPLQDVMNRKNLIIMAKSELDQAQSMAEAQRDEIRQLVIRQFNDVFLKQRLLKIRSKNFSTARVNNEMVEKEFQNGIISVTEYARIAEIVSRAESDYETAKTDYITAYMLLEETVGFKFNITTTLYKANENN